MHIHILELGHIKHFVELHANYAYLLIILGVILEGEIVVILAGIFASLGSLNVFIVFIATLIGGGTKSVIGYSIGYYLREYHSGRPIINQAERKVSYFLPRFNEKPFLSVFLSRFLILGLHWFSLIFSGYKKVKLQVFAEAELASLLLWSTVVLSLGYFFSLTALSVSRDIRKFFGVIMILFIGFFILERVVAFFIELIESNNGANNKIKVNDEIK